jgi:hypothetical protein
MPPTMPYVYPIVKTQNTEIYGSWMLKKSASLSSARRARLARQARSQVRSSRFQEPRTPDLEPSSVSPVPPVSLSNPAGVPVSCPTRADDEIQHAKIVFSQPASAEVVSLIVPLPSSDSNTARAFPSPLCCRLRLFVMVRALSCYAPGTEDSNLDPCPVFEVHIVILARKNTEAMRARTIKRDGSSVVSPMT